MGRNFSSDSNGVNLNYIWFGQVVDESTWVDNNAKEKGDDKHIPRTRDDFQGYGYRYKVRIFGRDLPDKEEGTTDEQLYMATTSLPPTAGSGHGGSTQTPMIKQGVYVWGFWADGVQATEPIIASILPNNPQTRMLGGDPTEGFVPRSGYKGLTGDKPVAGRNVLLEGGDHPFNENVLMGQTLNVSDKEKPDDGSPANWVPSTFNCDGSIGVVQNTSIVLQRVFYFINLIKSASSSFAGAVGDIQKSINSIIQDGAITVTNLMKDVLDRLRGAIIKELDKSVKIPVGSLPPNVRPIVNEITEKATTQIDCIINKIIDGLFNFIFKALSKIADKIINPVACAIQNFIGSLLAKILGPLSGAIDGIFGGLANSLSSLGSGSIGGFSISGLINTINGIINLLFGFSCEEERDCSAGKEWSLWYGAESITDTIEADLSQVVSNIRAVGEVGGGSGSASCDTSPVACGPPKIKITGGGGLGAIANAIVSSTGKVIGADILSGGVGYTSPPNVYLQDPCGRGKGARLVPILNSTNTLGDGSTFSGIGGFVSTPSRLNKEGIGSLSTIGGRKTTDTSTGIGKPIVSNGKYVVSTAYGDPTRFRNYISSSEDTTGLETITANVEGVGILTAYVGGIGGIPVFSGATGGTPLIDQNGNPIVVDQTAVPVVAGGTGGYVVTDLDNVPVFVGGTGGTPLVDTDFLPSIDEKSGIVDTNDNLLDNTKIDRSITSPGSFEGTGSFEDGKFSGDGTFTTDDGKLKIPGKFSGYDKSLSGLGDGAFNGNGILKQGKFQGEGKFLPNPSPSPKKTKDAIIQPNGTTIEEYDENGQKVIISINPDGTGTIKKGNADAIAVVFAKVNAKNGSPVIAGNSEVTDGYGNKLSTGGEGGSLARTGVNDSNRNLLNANGVPVTANNNSVSVGYNGPNNQFIDDGNGVPIVIGLGINKGSPIKSGNSNLTSNGNILTTSIKLPTKLDVNTSPSGVFAGPDGVDIVDLVVLNAGTGFLASPDGSTGGAGATFSNPDSTIKFNINTGYSVYPPNSTIPVVKKDLIYLPPGTQANVYGNLDNSSELLQTLDGKGQKTPLVILNDGLITTPKYDEDVNVGNLPSSEGVYPVILCLKSLLVTNPGGNYNQSDKITIEPSNGASAEPIFDEFGCLIAVNLTEKGEGFIDQPKIFIESLTGFNANITPVFEICRVGDLSENEAIPGPDLIQVIDCVGKIT